MRNTKTCACRGFSLIEVLIALSILTVGILAIMGLFPTLFRLNENTWNTYVAQSLAQEKLNQLMEAKTFISDTIYSSDTPPRLPGTGGYRRWIGVADPAGNTMMQYLYVEVRWVEKGRIREVRLVGSLFKE